jgi:hypothetical protein
VEYWSSLCPETREVLFSIAKEDFVSKLGVHMKPYALNPLKPLILGLSAVLNPPTPILLGSGSVLNPPTPKLLGPGVVLEQPVS